MFDPLTTLRNTVIVLLPALLAASIAGAQERVALTPRDGHPLSGTLVKPAGPPKGGVVAIPTSKSARVAFDPLLPRLAQAGLIAIAIDARQDDASGVESAPSRPADSKPGRLDLEAALELLVQRGAPIDKLAVIGAGSGSSLALTFAAQTGMRLKALVLLSPGRDAALPEREVLDAISPRATLVMATSDEAAKGADALREAMPGIEVQLFPDRLASATGMFGRVAAIESTIADWLDRALAQPSAIDIPESRLVSIDGEAAESEAAGAALIAVPLGDGSSATIRLTHTPKRLELGFDVPEPYVRLNEVVVYVDSSGRGGNLVDKTCYRVSFNPKNPARKPLLVQRGGLKGFEDTDDKGIIAFARTEIRRRWTAEMSLDFSRFMPGDLPKTIRIAFQVNGQRISDVRYHPDDAKVPTAPGAWAVAHVK